MTISTNVFKSAIISAIMGIMSIPTMHAIIAKPGVIQASQPDGTLVSIRLEGQFGNHRAYSSDGYLLTTDSEGYYVFADCTDDGMPAATNIRAINPELRTADINAAISRLDQSSISDAFLNRSDVSTRSGNTPMKGPGLFSNHFPTSGEQPSIAILVNFSDNSFSLDDPKDFYNRQLNEEGFSDYGATGSARDYFIENSYGQFMPKFDVYGPVTLDKPIEYYGANDVWGNDELAHEMIIDACQLLDDEIDFSKYDRNGDGVIDNVYVFYAGYGEADGGASTTIWPHSYDIQYASSKKYYFDGVQLNHYACSNEIDYSTKNPDGIGAFIHEFSHVMGLPDLYATDGSNAYTPAYWSVLDVGSYNNNSRTPPNYSAFERYALDWMEPEIIDTPGVYTLDHLADSNKAYMFPTEKTREYFLFENRQQKGNDTYLPGHGMLVWHIHFNQLIWNDNIVNNTVSHQYVDLVEADNVQGKKTTQAGESFPGKNNVTSYTSQTSPAFLSWAGVSPGFDIIDITESGDGIISFTAKAYGESGIDDILANDDSAPTINGREISCVNGTATVYDLSGKTVATVTSNPVTLQPGLYIVSYGNKTKKIAIK